MGSTGSAAPPSPITSHFVRPGSARPGASGVAASRRSRCRGRLPRVGGGYVRCRRSASRRSRVHRARRRQTRRPDVRIHRGRVLADRRLILGGLPVTRAGWVVGELLEDRVDPDAVAQIASEVLDRVLDYPRVVAESLAPYAARYGLALGDGLGLLDDFLVRAGNRDRDRLLAEASSL